MAKVYLSGLAKQDLSDAKRYISEELQNPEAAKRVLARIFKSLRVLEQFPYSGTPLQITGIETGYRSVATLDVAPVNRASAQTITGYYSRKYSHFDT